jgi:ZIP family zinc transporter
MINGYSVQTVLFAFGLTLFAGLSTGIGSAVAYFAKHTNVRFLSVALGFSAGVMIYISLVEIFHKALQDLQESLGRSGGYWAATVAFFGGMAVIALIDKLVPSYRTRTNLTQPNRLQDKASAVKQRRLHRMGVLTALAIAVHNFPEGLATFAAALTDPHLGIAIALPLPFTISPKVLLYSVPIYYATANTQESICLLFSVRSVEPLGAWWVSACCLCFSM